MGVDRFEELIAWQKARKLTSTIYKASARGDFGKDFGLRDQIRKASVSVMSNIAEGFDRSRPKEFKQFLSIAKGSCAEVRSQPYVALDVEYISEKEFNEIKDKANEVIRIVTALRTSVGKRPE